MSKRNGKQPVAASRTFAEASKHIQENLQKHLDRLPSNGNDSSNGDSDDSSDGGGGEDVQTTNNVLDSVFAGYDVGVSGASMSRTSEAIAATMGGGGQPCLICISGLKKNSAVWSCTKCFSTFHLNCIQQWANDCIFQQKNQLEDITQAPPDLKWACPKCRNESVEVPRKYVCFCGKVDNPAFDPWILPHSCGENCKKPLHPKCGHVCLILCHPGPCPPCPKMVKHDCHCANSAPAIRRCFEKEWSCGRQCGKRLNCGQHRCPQPCHPGECSPCAKTSVQLCRCQRQQRTRECASPDWQCLDKCGRPLACGHHVCEEVCHPAGANNCPPCPLSQLRTCPCGKTQHQLPCTEATPLCGNTCGKALSCGDHACSDRCHRGKCGTCLQMAKKSCRCGAKQREVACAKKDLTCEAKCKKTKACGKHPCNRKCCEADTCPPLCELPCNKTLSCRNHKCPSRCHPGQCQPCNQTKEVNCNCGKSRYLVPCGMEKVTKPPKCKVKCVSVPDCHHPARVPHNCHFGECPPCKQACRKALPACQHTCPAPCHDNVEVKVQLAKKAATPWDAVHEGTVGGVRKEVKAIDCPDCQVPVSVTCLGGHETSDWPCHLAKPSSCGRPCGRRLPCGNHACGRSCHKVKNAPEGEVEAGSNCRRCEAGCDKPRSCSHACARPCHPGACEACAQIIRVRCHCAISQLYVKCGEWTEAAEDKRAELGCCKDQCPQVLECGHRCFLICHRGQCGDRKLCKKKVKVYCPCKRVKQDVQCNKATDFVVSCNNDCHEAKKAVENEKKSKESVDPATATSVSPDQDSSELKRGKRRRRRYEDLEDEEVETFFSRNKTMILIVVVVLLPILTAYYLCTNSLPPDIARDREL